MRRLVAAAALAAAALATAGEAHADTRDQLAHSICSALDNSPTLGTVDRLLSAGVNSGFSAYDAGYLLGESVARMCPENLYVLQAWSNTTMTGRTV